MNDVTKEMVQLRHEAKAETVKAKMDERVVMMEKERDWFRGEALNLNIAKKKLENQVNDLTVRLR